ncbi:MAG: hypothetical protein H6721_32665 [Sandaracinus sp.]|nr:hypothetical protein [Sandaracinus sp.]
MLRPVALALVALAALVPLPIHDADAQGCRAGFQWNRRFGGCVQVDCSSVTHAHYAHGGECVCGSSGSVNERATDPNQECSTPRDDTTCSGCVYACVRNGQSCPAPPRQTPSTRATTPATASSMLTLHPVPACDLAEVGSIEAEARALSSQAEGLRRLLAMPLPTFPDLNYCVSTSDATIRVSIQERSAASQVLAAVTAAETALGFLDGPDLPGATQLTAGFNYVSGALRDGIVQARTTSSSNTESLEFLRQMHQTADGVNRVRERMICTVKQGVPEFRTRLARLEAWRDRILARLERGCPTMVAGARRTLGQKLHEPLQHARYFEGILPERAGTGYVRSQSWIDTRGARGEPQVFAEVRCR